jgi:hypothetical protein
VSDADATAAPVELLCTPADVEALLGYPLGEAQGPRIATLIEMASAVVGALVAWPPDDPEPAAIRYVTASLVVRTIANPGQLESEWVGAYRAGFGGAGMALTDDDVAILGPWIVVEPPGDGAYCVATPQPRADDMLGPFGWQQDTA